MMTTKLDEQILALHATKNAIKVLEAEEAALSAEIIGAMFADGQTEHLIPRQVKAAIQNKVTKTISRERLVARGVLVDVIDDCTDVNTSAPFVRLYTQKGDE